MKAMKNTKNTRHWLMKYTLTFFILCLVVFSLQIYYRKSFVYSTKSLAGDGLVQHYNALAYYGSWLRGIFKNIFINHSFSIPEYDLSIGLGGDILGTLNYYVMGDPLNLLSVLVPRSCTEYLYNALVIVRLYLAGIAFYLYCLYHGYEADRILPGVIIYVFSFYTIVISVVHPFFLNPLIYFPLILLGVDKVLKERKPLLFILSCALAAVSNFYFFYMMTILMVIYGIIRYVQYHLKDIKFLSLLQEIMSFALYYVVAVMIAAPIFLPSASAVLGSSRVGGGSNVPLVYELIYYIKLPIAFMNASADHYSALGYGAVGALAVILLFFKTGWKEKAGFKIAFLLGTVFLLIPFFGHVLNGFGYAINRWVWGYCFVVSLIIVEMFPAITSLPAWVKWAAAGSTSLFAIPTFYFRAGGEKEKLLAAAVVLLIFSVVLAAMIFLCRYFKEEAALACVLLMAANAFLSMFGFYSPLSGNDIQQHGDFASAWQDIRSGPFSVLDEKEDNQFDEVRIDSANLYYEGVKTNSAMLYDVNSTSFYYSVINESTNTFLHDLWIPTPYEHRYVDLDSRAMLSSLLGAKYTIIASGNERYLPYGYNRLVQEKNGYAMYETDYALPMAFLYDSAISEEEYNSLLPVQKEKVLMQAGVISENDLLKFGSDLSKPALEELQLDDTVSEYVLEEGNGVVIGENRFEAAEAGAFVTLRTEQASQVERYFSFDNLWYEGKRITTITITDDTLSKNFYVSTDLDGQYADIHDFLCNMGYAKEHGGSYRIIFNEPGIYTYDSIKIYNHPLDSMQDLAFARQAAAAEYAFGEDRVSLQVHADKDGLLYISIPYSDGWKACVDGEKAEIFRINEFGIGIGISPGEHDIELVYHTPYLHLGVGLMLLGICGCLFIIFRSRIKLIKLQGEDK